MSRRFLIIRNILLVLSILLILAIPVVSLISTALFWQGSCSGLFPFGDACTWWQYTMVNMILISFIAIPLLFVTLSVWLVMVGVQLYVERNK